MAKFTLPINSIVKKGKTFNDNPSSENKLRVDIYRYNPDQNKNPYVDTYIPVSYTHLTLPTICSV